MNSHRKYILKQCNAGAGCFESVHFYTLCYTLAIEFYTFGSISNCNFCSCCYCLLLLLFSHGVPFIACLLVDCTGWNARQQTSGTQIYTRFQWKLMRIKWALMEPNININMHHSKYAIAPHVRTDVRTLLIGSTFKIVCVFRCECALKLSF